jgi:hypothetical protein
MDRVTKAPIASSNLPACYGGLDLKRNFAGRHTLPFSLASMGLQQSVSVEVHPGAVAPSISTLPGGRRLGPLPLEGSNVQIGNPAWNDHFLASGAEVQLGSPVDARVLSSPAKASLEMAFDADGLRMSQGFPKTMKRDDFDEVDPVVTTCSDISEIVSLDGTGGIARVASTPRSEKSWIASADPHCSKDWTLTVPPAQRAYQGSIATTLDITITRDSRGSAGFGIRRNTLQIAEIDADTITHDNNLAAWFGFKGDQGKTDKIDKDKDGRMKVGDIIIAVNDEPVTTHEEYYRKAKGVLSFKLTLQRTWTAAPG